MDGWWWGGGGVEREVAKVNTPLGLNSHSPAKMLYIRGTNTERANTKLLGQCTRVSVVRVLLWI